MARVTVEDCLKYVDSNYDLVLRAAKRARAIAEGAEPLVERDNDKPTVLALREIAENVTVEANAESSVIEPPLFSEHPPVEIDIEA